MTKNGIYGKEKDLFCFCLFCLCFFFGVVENLEYNVGGKTGELFNRLFLKGFYRVKDIGICFVFSYWQSVILTTCANSISRVKERGVHRWDSHSPGQTVQVLNANIS